MGILGPPDPKLSSRVAAGPARDLVVRVKHRGATVWSSGPLLSWRARDRTGVVWWALREGRRASAWHEAAQSWEALGLEMTKTDATLHTASFGMQPLYTLRAGRSLVFAQSIDDLCAVVDGELHADWNAWAAIFAFGSPIGTRTPFAEITRLAPGESWTYDIGRDRLRAARRLHEVVEQTSGLPPTPTDVVDRMSMSIKRSLAGPPARAGWVRRWLRGSGPVPALTLSGGWDSRLLAASATAVLGNRSVVAYTTSPDDGLDLDIDLSGPVASTLGLQHKVLVPPSEAWPQYTRKALRRVEHQTRHHMWLEPLAETIRAVHDVVLDGIAGDVLLKNFMVDDRVIDAKDPRELRDALWRNLARVPTETAVWATRRATSEMDRRSREDFDAECRLLEDHPAAPTLSVLMTRTARCVSLSPFGLFAPEILPCAPFLDPDVVGAALAVPLREKAGGAFYRRVLEAAHPAVAALPSTNDPRPTRRRRHRIRAIDQAAMDWADSIATRMVDVGALPALPDGSLKDLARSTAGRNWLKGLVTFGDWLDRYGERLDDVRAPWWR